MYMKGLKRQHLNDPVARAQPMTKEILGAMRALLKTGQPNLVKWRTIWRAHVEFTLMLRHDDIKRLTRAELTYEENKTGKFIRMKLIGISEKIKMSKTIKLHVCLFLRWQNNYGKAK